MTDVGADAVGGITLDRVWYTQGRATIGADGLVWYDVLMCGGNTYKRRKTLGLIP